MRSSLSRWEFTRNVTRAAAVVTPRGDAKSCPLSRMVASYGYRDPTGDVQVTLCNFALIRGLYRPFR